MKKKLLKGAILVSAAILLVVASVLGTLAYLTSSSAVSNTFTVGNVGIQMLESKVNPDGTLASPAEKVDGNSYHLQPGGRYIKDPVITVQANSDTSYLFVKVRNDLRGVEAESEGDYKTMVEQAMANGWKYLGSTFNANVYVYKVLVGGTAEVQEYPIFSEFMISTEADLSLSGGAKITLTAFAIQETGFEANGEPSGAYDSNDPYMIAARSAWEELCGIYTYEDGTIISTTPLT